MYILSTNMESQLGMLKIMLIIWTPYRNFLWHLWYIIFGLKHPLDSCIHLMVVKLSRRDHAPSAVNHIELFGRVGSPTKK